MGKSEHLSDEDLGQIEQFVCQMYGYNGISSIDVVRLELFLKKYKSSPRQGLLFAKKIEGGVFPPCHHTLIQQIKRANFVAVKWLFSTSVSMPDMSPENCGWYLVDGKYKIKWFDGSCSPSILSVTVSDASDEEVDGMGGNAESDNEDIEDEGCDTDSDTDEDD